MINTPPRQEQEAPLPHPITNLRGYVAKAYLPRPPHVIVQHEHKRIEGGASTSTASRLLKCGVKPRDGRRMLVGVDTIDLDELNEACKQWYYQSIPRNVDFKKVATHNRGIFGSSIDLTRDDAIRNVGLDPRAIRFTLPAVSFQTIKAEVFDDDSDQTSPSTSPSTPSPELPDPPNTAVSDVWSVSTTTHTTRVSTAVRQTLLATAASVLHLSEPDRVKRWEWLTPEEAWDIAREQREGRLGEYGRGDVDEAAALLRNLSSEALDGWECWIWGKQSTASFPEGSVSSALGLLVIVQPSWVIPNQTFWDFASPQEFTDGLRGEPSFLTYDAVWAALHDTCRYLGIHHFVVTSYSDTTFGCFSVNHQTGLVAPPIEGIRGEPTVLMHLMYWMRSGMRDCIDGWLPPPEDGVAERYMKADGGNYPGVEDAVKKAMRPILLDPDVKAMMERDSYDDLAAKSNFLSARRAQVSQRLDLATRAEYQEAEIVGIYIRKDAQNSPTSPGVGGWVPPGLHVQAELSRKRKALDDEEGQSGARVKNPPKRTRKVSALTRPQNKRKGKAPEVAPSIPLPQQPPAKPSGRHRRTASLGDAQLNGSGGSTSHRTIVGQRKHPARIVSGTTQTRSATYADTARDDVEDIEKPRPLRGRSRSADTSSRRNALGQGPPPVQPRRSRRIITPPERLIV